MSQIEKDICMKREGEREAELKQTRFICRTVRGRVRDRRGREGEHH